MNAIINSLELVTRKQASEVCHLDSKLLTQDRARFTKANSETWYVLINTWLHLIQEVSQRTRILAQEYIFKNGLIPLIKDGDEVADAIMHDNYDPMRDNHVWLYLFQDCADSVDAERKILTVLRFAKRVSPAYADLTDRKSLDSFLQVNTDNRKMFLSLDSEGQYGRADRYVYNFDVESKYGYLWQDVVREYNRLVPWGDPAFKCDLAFEQKICDLGEFSNGSTFEGAKTLKEKLLCYSKHYDNFGHVMYPTSEVKRKVWHDNLTVNGRKYGHMEEYICFNKSIPTMIDIGNNAELIPNACRVTAVPKSFKTSRIIAQEQTWRGFVMQGLRKYWVDFLEKSGESRFIDVEDQTPNQEWCRMSSISDSWATVDSSHASDSISMVLGYELNARIKPFLDRYISQWMLVDGKYVKSNIFLTSGTAITFINESCVFLAIARAATNYVALFSECERLNPTIRVEKQMLPPRVFGDDVLIDVRAMDTFIELMTYLGFTVNKSKSFGLGSRYRESCGVEYRNGYPLHTIKWPRTCFRPNPTGKMTPENLASLTSLQHKVFDFSWNASRFLIEYVRWQMPAMTSSKPFVECDDLWEDLPRWKPDVAPIKGIPMKSLHGKVGLSVQLPSDPQWSERELHYTLKSVYGPVGRRDSDTEMYRYTQFLKEGPVYSSKLDELLGVTTNPARSSQLIKPTLEWRLSSK